VTECRLAPDCLCRQATMQGEIGRLDVNNPNYILELGVGPPVPNLVPQQPGTGAVLAGEQQQISNWATGNDTTPAATHACAAACACSATHSADTAHCQHLTPACCVLNVRPVLAPAGALHLQKGARLSRRLQVRD
jgi:hypothetical protein